MAVANRSVTLETNYESINYLAPIIALDKVYNVVTRMVLIIKIVTLFMISSVLFNRRKL